jgi:hypothetical protein
MPWCWGASASEGPGRTGDPAALAGTRREKRRARADEVKTAVGTVLGAATALGVAFAISAAGAATPDGSVQGRGAAPERLELSKEVVVRNWILCISQAHAEEVVRATDGGSGETAAVIARLQEEKACGRFPEMQVILERPVAESSPLASRRARAYGARINLGGEWVPAFVVYADQPRE